jgi:phosphoglycerate dehydrogenase-like enzyme
MNGQGTINVLVVNKIDDEGLKKISGVSPRINLMTSWHLWDAQDTTSGKDTDCDNPEFNSMLARAEVIFGYRPPKNIVQRAPNLKWIHTVLAGVDHFLDENIIKSNILVTHSSGIHGIQISEVVFEKMLMFVKMAPMYFKYQNEKIWERHILGRLYGKTLGIIGLGNIGKRVALLGKAFGMRVIATRRSARKISKAPYVDVVYPRAQLDQILKESDFVVMILPTTPETRNMIGKKEIELMKPNAYLINVGRGSTLDEEALVQALEEKRIAGAGLDAYAVEPLPRASKLWELPNAILTPHIAGPVEDYFQRTTDLFCKNLELYVTGKKLFNLVDKKRGY